MELKASINILFDQLSYSERMLSYQYYTKPLAVLSGATVDQHVRQVIELCTCLFKCYETGTVNYEKRKRDAMIETDRLFADDLMLMICSNLEKEIKALLLKSNYNESTEKKLFYIPIAFVNFYTTWIILCIIWR